MRTLVHVRQLPLLHILTYDNGGPLTILVTLECLEHNTLDVGWMFGLCMDSCFPAYIWHTHCTAAEKRHMSLKRLQT